MDITVDVGTDIASFSLYEPEALQHRAQSPWCWVFDASALGTAVSESPVPIDNRLEREYHGLIDNRLRRWCHGWETIVETIGASFPRRPLH